MTRDDYPGSLTERSIDLSKRDKTSTWWKLARDLSPNARTWEAIVKAEQRFTVPEW